jgi:hypothetical protein
MAKISKDLSAGTLHPRENLFIGGTIGALNAEIITDCDGCSSFTLDLRGTAVLTVEVSGTVDGTNWTLIPVRALNLASVIYLAAVVYPVGGGVWTGVCGGFERIRARCTAYTSGSVAANLNASTAILDQTLQGRVTPSIATVTAAAGAIATLSIPNPGVGLRNYITYISVNRFASALLVAGATPVLVTTTNLPGTLVFSFPADAAAAGTLFPLREDFTFPLASSAQNTATTVVGPATTNVIWRITAGFYVAP